MQKVRRNACERIIDLRAKAADAVPLLVKLLHDSNGDVRHSAVTALLAIGPDAHPAIPILTRLIVDTKETKGIRDTASLALAEIGPKAIPALAKIMEGKDSNARALAADSMSRLVHFAGGTKVVPLLINALDDKSEEVRFAASESLTVFAHHAMPALEKALQHPVPFTRVYASLTILEIDPRHGKALATAMKEAQSANSEVRSVAVSAIVEAGKNAQAAVPLLV